MKKKFTRRIKMELSKKEVAHAEVLMWVTCPHCARVLFFVQPDFEKVLAKWKKQPPAPKKKK